MNRPEPNMTASEEDASSVTPAESWGEKEVAREIALLEAHVQQDIITCAIDALAALDVLGDDEKLAKTLLPVDIEEELRQSYLDYAMSVIVGRALPTTIAVGVIRDLSHRARSVFSHLGGLANLYSHELAAALAIFRLNLAERSASILLLKLQKAADSACLRIPLFAYGPELTKFRHRFR